MKLLSTLLEFVKITSLRHKIDESHALGHSMDVLHFTNQIYMDNIWKYSELRTQENVIYTSAILHDMCDKKYMNQSDGILQINDLLKYKMPYYELKAVNNIVSTMSYSFVKENGFPTLGTYQMAYHIVREADLLSAYDFDRSIIYHMYKSNGDFYQSFDNACILFENRVLKHHIDGLFVTEYSKKKGLELHEKAILQMKEWKKIINSYERDNIL